MTRSMSILYVMSDEPNNMKVLGQVMKFAEQHRANLTLLHVIDSLPQSSRMLVTSIPTGDIRNSVVRRRLAQLEALISRIRFGSGELRPRVRFGEHAIEITREAAEGGYDLVIKNPEKGKTDKYLLRNCNCPVWLLTPDGYDEYGQLLASRGPQFTMKDEQPPVKLRVAT